MASQLPATLRHQRPYGLYYAEWPSASQESVYRRQNATSRKPKYEQCAALLKCIADHHGRYSEQAERRKGIHYLRGRRLALGFGLAMSSRVLTGMDSMRRASSFSDITGLTPLPTRRGSGQ